MTGDEAIERGEALTPMVVAPASHHLVSPALGWSLRHSDDPDPLHEYFAAALDLNRTRNTAIMAGLELLLAALARHGVLPLAMKGSAALLHGLYPDPGARVLSDLDLLVDEGQIARAVAAAEEAGFAAAPTDRPLTWHHHVPCMVHPKLGTGVDLHSRPLFTTDIVTSRGLFADAIPATHGGRPILLPSATDMIAHLVAHSQVIDANHRRATAPLRYLLELGLMVERFGAAIDWPDLMERFARARQSEALAMTCAASDYFFGPRTPFAHRAPEAAAWLQRGLTRSAMRRWLVELRFRLRDVPSLARHEPARLLNAARPSRWRNRTRAIPDHW